MVMLIKNICIVLFSIFLITGCKTYSDIYSVNTDNQILFTFGGATHNDLRVEQDHMISALGLLNITGQIESNASYEELSPSKRYENTKKMEELGFKEASERVGNGGNLYWIFSGHGDENGAICESGQGIKGRKIILDNIMEYFRQGREGKPKIRRLVMFINSCYSGKFIENLARYKGTFFEEVITFTASPVLGKATDKVMDTSLYESVRFLKEARNNISTSIDDLINQDKDALKYISELNKCGSISFKNETKKQISDNSNTKRKSPSLHYRSDKCPTYQIDLNRECPTIDDLYQLMFLISTLTSLDFNTYGGPQLVTLPQSLRNEPLWSDGKCM